MATVPVVLASRGGPRGKIENHDERLEGCKRAFVTTAVTKIPTTTRVAKPVLDERVPSHKWADGKGLCVR